MNCILVCCAAGYTNAGDDAILQATLAVLHSRFPGAQVSVACGRMLNFPLHGAKHVPLESQLQLEQAILGSDLVVLGGGGILYDSGEPPLLSTLFRRRPQWILFSFRVALLCRVYAIPLYVCGVGIGPVETHVGEELVRFILESANKVTVRDSHSYKQAMALTEISNVVRSFCPVLNYAGGGDVGNTEDSNERVVGISLRPQDIKYCPALADVLNTVHGKCSISLRLLVHQRFIDCDHAAFRALRSLVKRDISVKIWTPTTPDESRSLIRSCEVLLSSRLHPAIMAASTLTPFYGLCISSKLEAFVSDLGWAHCCSVDNLSEKAASDLLSMIGDRQRWTAELKENIDTLIGKLPDPLSIIPSYVACSGSELCHEREQLVGRVNEGIRSSRFPRSIYCLLIPLRLRAHLHTGGIALKKMFRSFRRGSNCAS